MKKGDGKKEKNSEEPTPKQAPKKGKVLPLIKSIQTGDPAC